MTKDFQRKARAKAATPRCLAGRGLAKSRILLGLEAAWSHCTSMVMGHLRLCY